MHLSDDNLSHDEALAFLYGRIDYERAAVMPYRSAEFKLQRMRELLDRLGNPQQAVKVVHVAGTKGKGSTATMIAAILTESGYRTGLYTSPHFDRLEERLSIDGQACHDAELVELVAQVTPAVIAMDSQTNGGLAGSSGLTFFEIVTAMALLHFAQCGVDLAVLEVGLGGRLDSTNVCSPLVSVITSISYDHMQQLGDTLECIAAEKAGIIKQGVPVVSGVTQAEPQSVIERIARCRESQLFTLGREFDFTYMPPNLLHSDLRGGQRRGHSGGELSDLSPLGGHIDYYRTDESGSSSVNHLRLGLLGRHQAANAAVALAAVDRLRELGWPAPALAAGLSQSHCPARIEVVSRWPVVIIDAAHNVASARALVATLQECFTPSPRTLVFATSKDKDACGMLRVLLPRFQRIVLTRYVDNLRSADPRELREIALSELRAMSLSGESAPEILVCEDPQSAWRQAGEGIDESHGVCVAGSFFLAVEIRRLMRTKSKVHSPRGVSAACEPIGKIR